MMKGYILSILGIVILGIFIDIILPSGSVNKYIKSLYSIFVIAVILNPLLTFFSQHKDFKLQYVDYETNTKLLNYIYNQRVNALEKEIILECSSNGFDKIDINLNYIVENNQIVYSSCQINLKNLVIHTDKQHINKYEFINEVVRNKTNLTNEEIIYE